MGTMRRPKDKRKGDESITRYVLWRSAWLSLTRLARFVGVACPANDTPHARWNLVETLYSVTRRR